MGVTNRTIERIREDFNFSKDVKIIRAEKLTEVAPNGFTCITIGQLEAGLKIPLYHPERPLQYEVLRLLSRAPGQMNGNFFRIINQFEDYNKANPERKYSAEEFIMHHYVLRSKVHPHCFIIRQRKSFRSVLPIKVGYDISDHNNWHKFPILISGNWIHHPDLPPPPEIYFNPINWILNKNSTVVKEENSTDDGESTSASTSHSNTLKSGLKKSKSNLKNSVPKETSSDESESTSASTSNSLKSGLKKSKSNLKNSVTKESSSDESDSTSASASNSNPLKSDLNKSKSNLKNSVTKESSSDESESTSASSSNSNPLKSDLGKSKSNLKNSVTKESSSDESESTSASSSNSNPLKSDLGKSKSNLKNSVTKVTSSDESESTSASTGNSNPLKFAEKPHSPSKKTQHSTAVTSPLLHSSRHNTVTVLNSKDEENQPVLKRQRKVSEASTKVCPGSSVDNGRGPKFEELEGESEFSKTGGWKGLVYIGNFPVLDKFAALYRQIWQRHGHLATRKVMKSSTFILVVAVSKLLESITLMASMKLMELDASHLTDWDEKIAEAEALQFEVGWLRKHFNEVRKTLDAASSQSNSKETHEKALNSALQRQSAVHATVDSLKVQLEKAEQEFQQVTFEVIQHQHVVSVDLAATKRYMSSLQKTFLQDAV